MRVDGASSVPASAPPSGLHESRTAFAAFFDTCPWAGRPRGRWTPRGGPPGAVGFLGVVLGAEFQELAHGGILGVVRGGHERRDAVLVMTSTGMPQSVTRTRMTLGSPRWAAWKGRVGDGTGRIGERDARGFMRAAAAVAQARGVGGASARAPGERGASAGVTEPAHVPAGLLLEQARGGEPRRRRTPSAWISASTSDMAPITFFDLASSVGAWEPSRTVRCVGEVRGGFKGRAVRITGVSLVARRASEPARRARRVTWSTAADWTHR